MYRRPIVEAFVLVNVAFLAVDIYIAHSVNRFAHSAEWIPFYFSIGAPVFLFADLIHAWRRNGNAIRYLGIVIGAASIAIGISGLVLHLNSRFFAEQTLHSLVYTAPFAAPLAYAGLGFLLLLNRMVKSEDLEWGQWLIFFALGGFVGNFALSLCDHAQNGFFFRTEWIPVIASAFAIGFLTVAMSKKPEKGFLNLCFGVMAVQVVVGLLGFYFHGVADTGGSAQSFFEKLVHGAPPFAPLLFVNLAILAAIGLWDVRSKIAGNPSGKVAPPVAT